MTLSRRGFLRGAGGLIGVYALADAWRKAEAFAPMPMSMPMASRTSAAMLAAPKVPLINPTGLARFVDPLPIPPVMRAAGQRAHPHDPGRQLPYYRLQMRAFKAKLHRDVPATPLWGYEGQFPGPTLETRRDEPLLVEWANALPAQHFLPIDHNLHGAEKNQPDVRAVTHVHGARVPADADGYPERWYTPGHSATYLYPNGQDAATLWYHDHAMGITRLNVYAGLAGTFIVRDAQEQALNLPSGDYDIPLMLCDRLLAQDGQLYYPVSDDPDAPWVMQCNGNLPLCNGKIFPYLEVEPRKYRFRLINIANTSFFDLTLSQQQPFQQIASDQGLLAKPVERARIELYPAERADVVIDFSALAGKTMQLRHQSQGILEFRVRGSGKRDSSVVPASLREVPRLDPAGAVKHRVMTLNEVDDANGNALSMQLDGKRWSDPVSENPRQHTLETWSFVNLTGDAHPIHLHLVRFQILDRRPFDLFAWNARRELTFTGPAVAPEPHELGWKDTVRADPGMVTRIAMRFDGEPGRYVWHCHFLEHEDNDMMRPYDLLTNS
ncbi:multicopper oxidase family protein [Dyella acidiphila]|uniref:Multicopper oxidase domain-containing protein n=1 Tax=Dyella acidiphila TaxID=2775866 RepID=A0ABR9GEJ9_9GAMM|nr:multicopper oxidase domain-containing protein [Dyella acidiphila]MBE1162475.1 multicopper oxidase domain-containing protein [Dyella acidiphila]